ncbi:DNA-processing protein DprA [Serratia marcescens]|uniref:DNA-processing protein DprA n=1 Tax=Serratia marcescens TaxID=615 RepID=UPI001D0AA9A7|nr:DNA-processing protein DprA [Serratia marcescens]
MMDENKENQYDSVEYWKNEIVAFLALTCLKGVGYWTLRKIAESGVGFKYLLKASSAEHLTKFLRVSLPKNVSWEDYQQVIWNRGLERARVLNGLGVKLYFYNHKLFPPALKKIPDPPYWIFVEGSIDNLIKRSVAIVGTRKPSLDGIFLTKMIVAAIANKSIPTVSGLASGIDQLAHIESLRYGIPTVAVLGNGFFVEYPKGSNELKSKIVEEGGTIVSEYLPDQNYSAENFVRRNRIQAALCSVLVPVEWKIKSGTAHTVEYAHKYKKKILNIFLPNTYVSRAEIKFSEVYRDAFSCEMPGDVNKAIDYISGEINFESNPPTQQVLDL